MRKMVAFLFLKTILSLSLQAQQQVLWGSYFGGEKIDTGTFLDKDTEGNLYLLGETESLTGIATPFADNVTHGASPNDCFLSKFSAQGSLIWSTYVGGHLYDAPTGLYQFPSGNVLVCGFTLSNNNIALPGAYQVARAGDIDGFFAMYDPNGTKLYGTYFGGIGLDVIHDIQILNESEILILGESRSPDLAVGNVHQSVWNGTTSDAFLARFNFTTNSLVWFTYYGGRHLIQARN